jgi:hypothetical protein
MTAYEEVEVYLHPFLIAKEDGGEWSASHLGRFTHGNGSRYPFNRELDGPPNSKDIVENGAISFPSRESNHDSSVFQPVA